MAPARQRVGALGMTAPVTVVVPTRDRRMLLAATLTSILSQRAVDVRVVVVDDGSNDGTPAFARSLDARIEVIGHATSTGAARARNDGLARVDTPWVAFCDDDDLWAPTKLAAQLAALASAPSARWSCTGAVCVDGDLRVVEEQRMAAGADVLARLLVANEVPGGGSSVLVATDLVRAVGGFAEDLPSSEDWELWIRLAERSPVAVVDEPLVAYRVWSGGKSRRVDRMEAAFDEIQHRHRALADRAGVRGDRRAHQRYLAKQALRAGDRVGAARRFVRGGSPRRAATAMVAPGLLERVGTSRARRAVTTEWATSAEQWLARIQSEVVDVA